MSTKSRAARKAWLISRRKALKGGVALIAAGLPVVRSSAQTPRPRPYRVPRLPRPRVLPKPKGTIFFAPSPPAYPAFDDPAEIVRHAQGLSDALEEYVRAWLSGRADATIPPEFLPPGINSRDFVTHRLVRPEEVRAEDIWSVRPAEAIATGEGHRGFFPDPNCTYLVVPSLLAPFGSKVVIEGEFPHARFFDVQLTPPLDPYSYRYDAAGVGEVPIVDADIEPLPGHTNPFRVGGNRDAVRRGYRVRYDLTTGDAVRLNPAFRPPNFRARGNDRVGGAILFRGPWGIGGSGGDGRGPFGPGELWLRYYLPDDGRGPLGGVPLPRVWCELPTGERYWILSDNRAFLRRINRRTRPRTTTPEPDRKGEGPGVGWFKQAGIFRSVIGGIAAGTGFGSAEYVRLLDKGVAGRGSDLPAPNNYEQSATSATYIDYLVRGMSCGRGKVVVLTGRLPTFPRTSRGEPRMTAAQMRYWSLVGYVVPEGFDFLSAFSADAVVGVAQHAVRDDQLVLDDDRFYVIALSKAGDRPSNANPDAGVTWVDWGPAGKISWNVRWLTVGPEWKGRMTPSPELLGRRGESVEPSFDPRVISTNGWDGAIGEHLPRVSYMTVDDFEALGSQVTARDVPVWR